MLTIGKLAAGSTAGRYYVDQIAQGREDHYAGEGEAPGAWMGSGAASLGLYDEVNEQGVVRLLSGENPATGELLRRPLATALTFDPAAIDRHRTSRDGRRRDARSIPANSRSAKSAATEPVVAWLARGLTAETLRDVIAAESRAVLPAGRAAMLAPSRPRDAQRAHLRETPAPDQREPTHDTWSGSA
jgi:TrwC relaxase